MCSELKSNVFINSISNKTITLYFKLQFIIYLNKKYLKNVRLYLCITENAC